MKTILNMIFFTIISSTVLHANCYQHLSISELEKEVETRSQNGTLPFEMGLELIQRWSNGEVSAWKMSVYS